MRGSYQRDLSAERSKLSVRRKRLRANGRPSAPKGRRSLALFFLRWSLVLFVWVGVFALGLSAYIARGLPDTDAWMRFDHRDSVTIRADDRSVIATFGDAHGENLHLRELPKFLIDAVIATEDRRFFSHHGVDPLGIARAIWVNIKSGSVVQGGSTITQQLAKNVFLTPDRTMTRKFQELALAVWLERHYSKDQILEAYFNRIYFGASAYGVDAAARRYFGKSARNVDLAVAAILAGLPRAPTRFSPINDPAMARARARQVLINMVDAGVLTTAAAVRAAIELRGLAMAPVMHSGSRYFADWIQDEVADAGYHGDITITTTLDSRLQAAAEAAVGRVMSRDSVRVRAGQAALVAMTPEGGVKALVGGRNYGDSPFNRATQANRPPGSAFKPIVYLSALEHGYHPDSIFFDGPVSIHGWQPRDFEPGYRGDVTMSEALALSLNTVAAQVADRVGIENVIATAHSLGIVSALRPDPSLALGTNNVTLLELTSVYAVLANGGTAALPFGVESVEDSSGNVLFRRLGAGGEQVANSDHIEQMTHMLEGVIDHGTGRAAAIGRPAAGKTGTTSDFRDALFVGYTSDLVAGVWVGNDDDTPMRHVTGGSLPAEIWRNFMLTALKGAPPRALDANNGSFSSERRGGNGLESVWRRTIHLLGLGAL